MFLKLKDTVGKLPTSEYELFDGDSLVGKIQIRHTPSHGMGVPENLASHIYYEIIPEYQGRGYGKEILALGIEKAKEIGLKEIFITCMENNLASKKIIESNGGIFMEEAIVPDKGKMLKYKISIN